MEETAAGPPRAFPITSLKQLRERSYFQSANFEFNKSSVPLRTKGGTSREQRPRLLACHDLKGNYRDDQWIQGSQNPHAYTLTQWRLLDSFVYFSHELVTLPPPGWTNAAHKHGVQVLGTLITEWAEGAVFCRELLESEEAARMYADRLAELAEALGFDGWLVNIENKVEKEQVAALQELVRHLTVRMHAVVPGSLVLWYDSVTTEGKLAWQDKLNEKNKPFFDLCDGIFTNYGWKGDYPRQSAAAAGEGRAFDVYMGVDVFGRGSFGGGQFGCDVALNAAREGGVSVAMFAPAWAYETDQDQGRWWDRIENCWPAARPDPVELPFFSDFDVGRGIAKCLDARRVSDLPWSNLSSQNLQPRLRVSAAAEGGQFEVILSEESAVYSGGVCVKASGDVGHDEVCIVQLYHTETVVEEASLNVSYSVMRRVDSNFCLALSAEDSKGAKVIFFLLDSKEEGDVDVHSLPRSHQFTRVSAVFERSVKGHDSASVGAGASTSSGADSSESDACFSLDSVVSGSKKWTVRDFLVEWGRYTIVDIFGICSAAKDLQPILIKLLRENETLFDGKTNVPHAESSTQQSNFGSVGSSAPSVEEFTQKSRGQGTNVGCRAKLGHISISPAGHEHCAVTQLEFSGHDTSWLRDGGSRYLSVNLRWELPDDDRGSGGAWTPCVYHLFVTVGRSDKDTSSPPPSYVGSTMLGCFYVYVLPIPKPSTSVTFNLLIQCPCGKMLPSSSGSFTLAVPSHESEREFDPDGKSSSFTEALWHWSDLRLPF